MLGWLELPEEDQPPEDIWLDTEALTAHFEQVKERWKGDASREEVEDVPMTDNELARELRGSK